MCREAEGAKGSRGGFSVRPTLKPTEEGLPEGVGARKPWHLPPRGREVMKVSMEVAVG